MHERGDVDVEWDAGTTAVKDFDGEVETTHAGVENDNRSAPPDATVRAPIANTKSSPTRAQTEAFGSAAILRSPALGTAPSRVVPKPADDAAPVALTAKEWSAPTEASPLAKARRASSQRGASSSELPLAAPEPSVLSPLAPVLPRGSQPIPTRNETAPPVEAAPVEPAPIKQASLSEMLDASVPPPTMRIDKVRRGSTMRVILAAAFLVAIASGAYVFGRKYQSRPQPAAAAPSAREVTKVVMPTVQAPTPTDAVETMPVVATPEAQPKLEPAKSVAAVQAKPARPIVKKKVVRSKAKAVRAKKASAAPSTSCTALDCL